MRASVLMLGAAMILIATSVLQAAGKPAPPAPNWRCKIVFRDAAGDKIQSDGATYTDGAGGVQCYVLIAPGASHDRWLYMNITNTRKSPSSRYIRFVGQSFEGASYTTFNNHEGGSFEVKALAKVEWNPADPARRDVMPLRAMIRNSQFANGYARLDADSNFTGGEPSYPTSSVFVQPIDACSWTITSYTTEEPSLFISALGERDGTRLDPRVMRIWEGNAPNLQVRGEFPMPFQATVTIIANKAGCPLP